MKRVKGCLNSQCSEYKKSFYKESDEFCVKCGTKLSFVCKNPKCFKQIPDNIMGNLCPVHYAEKQDKKERRHEKVVKAGSVVAAGVAVVGGIAKVGIDIAKKK